MDFKKRKKPTYTPKIHSVRLRRMLRRSNVTAHCPAAKGFSAKRSSIELWARKPFALSVDYAQPCQVCRAFVGIEETTICKCPCHVLGYIEAIKRSYAALKKHKLTK